VGPHLWPVGQPCLLQRAAGDTRRFSLCVILVTSAQQQSRHYGLRTVAAAQFGSFYDAKYGQQPQGVCVRCRVIRQLCSEVVEEPYDRLAVNDTSCQVLLPALPSQLTYCFHLPQRQLPCARATTQQHSPTATRLRLKGSKMFTAAPTNIVRSHAAAPKVSSHPETAAAASASSADGEIEEVLLRMCRPAPQWPLPALAGPFAAARLCHGQQQVGLSECVGVTSTLETAPTDHRGGQGCRNVCVYGPISAVTYAGWPLQLSVRASTDCSTVPRPPGCCRAELAQFRV
jgi:hypothetical protein